MWELMKDCIIMIIAPFVLTIKIWTIKRLLIDHHRSSSWGRCQRSSQQEDNLYKGNQENGCGGSHHTSSQNGHRYLCPSLGNGDGGGPYNPPSDNGHYPDPLVVDMMVIMVQPVVVMVAHWMIYMEQVHNAAHPLSWREDESKNDKIDILYRTNFEQSMINEKFAIRCLALSTANTKWQKPCFTSYSAIT